MRPWSGSARFFSAALATAGLFALASAASAMRDRQADPFPHASHEGLFPVCTGCHQGFDGPAGEDAAFPDPASCSSCHDGVVEDRVVWEGPRRAVTNVRFDHSEHMGALDEAGDPGQTCADCHVTPAAGRMAVAEPRLPTCWGCHEHAADDHTGDALCETCHVSLAESGFPLARIEALPVPDDHAVGSFLETAHGAELRDDPARCATCHTRDRCLACHVDAGSAELATIPPAPAGMELPVAVAHYNVPRSHVPGEDWIGGHSDEAATGTCATCHTRDDCATCHVSPQPVAVASLPARAHSVAPGVGLTRAAPSSHESPFFAPGHGALAAAEPGTCATCHEERECVACHDAPSGGGYHPAGFVSRHQSAAFGREADCATCHNTQIFCRSCHVDTGVAASGRVGPGYHAGASIWLLRHGQAARQNLESCASCHAQNDCVQCHGTLGAFKINPHGRDFDARAAWAKNPRTCTACHLTNPLVGTLP